MYSIVCLGLCRASSLVLSGEGYHDEDGRAVQAAFRWRAVGTMAQSLRWVIEKSNGLVECERCQNSARNLEGVYRFAAPHKGGRWTP
jgi:Zn finger protein HypA/HybF involved in hydrogenase expression